jgi:hypothetical protein
MTSPPAFDHHLARSYLIAGLANLTPEQERDLGRAIDREPSTIEAWKTGRRIPHRYLWPRLSVFFGEPSDAMFRAALGLSAASSARDTPRHAHTRPALINRSDAGDVSRAEFDDLVARMTRIESAGATSDS